MPTNRDDITTIRNRFFSLWPSNVQTVLDNEPPIDEPATMWARFTVMPGAERRASIASRTYDQLGRVYLQIFVPNGEADGEAWALAETFAATFRDWSSGDCRIRFDTPDFRTQDAADQPFMILVTLPYTAKH